MRSVNTSSRFKWTLLPRELEGGVKLGRRFVSAYFSQREPIKSRRCAEYPFNKSFSLLRGVSGILGETSRHKRQFFPCNIMQIPAATDPVRRDGKIPSGGVRYFGMRDKEGRTPVSFRGVSLNLYEVGAFCKGILGGALSAFLRQLPKYASKIS